MIRSATWIWAEPGQEIRGFNARGNHIDEVDERQFVTYIQATLGKNRRNEHGRPSISIITMNPNDTWAKELFYDKWKAGTLPPNVDSIEFGLEDSWLSARDVASLMTNPDWWIQRFRLNNWDYSDDSASLFKSRHWATSLVYKIDAEATSSAGYDVARSGTPISQFAACRYGTTIAELFIITDKTQQIDWRSSRLFSRRCPG